MAPFVNHTDSPDTIEFEDSEFSNLSISLEWTITTDLSGTDDLQRLASAGSSIASSLVLDGEQMELKDVLEKAEKMEEENSDLKSQIDMVILAKQSLEKTIIAEKKSNSELQEKVTELQQQLEEALERANNAVDAEKQEKLDNQFNYLIDILKAGSDKSGELQKEIESIQQTLS